MITSMTYALSGMLTANLGVDAIANNVANLDSIGAVPTTAPATATQRPYQPIAVDQVSLPGGGSRAIVRNVTPSYQLQYQPESPLADSRGMVAAPNIDPGREMVKLLSMMHAFELNAKVLQVSADMVKRLYDLKD